MIYDTDLHQPLLFNDSPRDPSPPPSSRRHCASWSPSSRLGPHYVVDTNILLDDPAVLHRAGSAHLCLPLDVLAELDRFKQRSGASGAHARSVHRILHELFAATPHPSGLITTRGGGSIQLVPFDPAEARRVPALRKLDRLLCQPHSADHRILACSLFVRHRVDGPVVLLTRDLNLALKARVFALETRPDFPGESAPAESAPAGAPESLDVSVYDLQRFASSGILHLTPGRPLPLNTYLLLRAPEGHAMPARYHGNGVFQKLRSESALQTGVGGVVKPLNFGQRCFLDALLDPSIHLVTCRGAAGTGKTLLAIAAGLHSFLDGAYQGITVSRPIVAVGDDLGYLPGTLHEKMHPWLQPIHDAFQFLLNDGRSPSGRKGTRKNPLPAAAESSGSPLRHFVEAGVIEVQPLCYIRGRSIANRFFLLDEAQQLTPAETKTAVTRMGKNAKLVLVGDPDQTDHPSLDAWNNGLVFARERLGDLPFAAHLALTKSERSPLAEAAARLM